MPFQYASFISYRRGQRIVDRFVKALCEALSAELELYLDLGIFYDESSFTPSKSDEKSLAKALCESVCMLMVFTPTYFSEAHPYCAREYKGMLELERNRLNALGCTKHMGLILPVVLRGANLLPKEIVEQRHLYNFDDFLVADARIYRSVRFRRGIDHIAQSIVQTYSAFQKLGNDPCTDCASFQLPSIEEIKPWLKTLDAIRPLRFPFS